MKNSNLQRTITFFKPHVRGDEVGTLFFAVTILCFLIISFFRLSIIGKALDDFCFNFLFGWIKYLIYGISFFVIIPLCFDYRLKMKAKSVGKVSLLIVIACWTTKTLALMINNPNHLYSSYYNLNLISSTTSYVNMWWDNSIFVNYNGFFGNPISFCNFSFNTFFPSYATGGMISTILTGLFNYGFFVTNLFANISAIFLLICWLFFKRPLIVFNKIKLFCITIIRKFKCIKHESKTKSFTKKELKAKKLLHEQNRKQILADKNVIEKEVLKEIKDIKKQNKNTSQLNNTTTNIASNLDATIKLKQQQILFKQNQQVENEKLESEQINLSPELIYNKSKYYFNEDSHLTPFGKINAEKQKDNVSVNKGTLIIKKSLEDSVFNNKPLVLSSENNLDE